MQNVPYFTRNNHLFAAHSALNSTITPDYFTPTYWERQDGAISTPGGRGSAWFITWQEHDCVLRHYQRGGYMANYNRDRYVYTGLTRTRAWREYHLLASLHPHLPVPEPIAWHIERHGLFYTADLITRRIPHTQTLAQYLLQETPSPALWKAVGHCIAQCHAHHVYHADLNAHNILVDRQEKIWLIDFDKCDRKRITPALRKANLSRLHRSLCKLQKAIDWPQLLEAYTINVP